MKFLLMICYAWRGELAAKSTNGRLMALASTEPVVEANDTTPWANQDHGIKNN